LLRVSVGLDEDAIYDMEDTVRDKNVGTNNLGAAAVRVLDEKTGSIR
jgi:hypothetical protein